VAHPGLLNEFGAKTHKLLIGDRSRFFEPIKLLDPVGSAETNHTPQLLACLRSLLAASFGHASRLGDQVREYRKIGEHDASVIVSKCRTSLVLVARAGHRERPNWFTLGRAQGEG
jgi:hypothetical protein